MANRRQLLKGFMLGGAITLGGLPVKLLAGNTTKRSDTSGDPGMTAPAGLLKDGAADRQYWVDLLYKMAAPVLLNLSKDELRKNMVVKKSPTFDSRTIDVTYLEAVGRTLAGVAPWLALPDDDTKEGKLRKTLREAALKGLPHTVNPASKDYLNFHREMQPIVDTAYYVQAFIRAPKALWEPLDELTKKRVVKEVKSLRDRKPFESNWVIFGSMAEAFLLSIGEQYDKERLMHGVDRLKSWYVGDGWYSDGPRFAFDYYNAYVMHPFMVDTLKILSDHQLVEEKEYLQAHKRMVRYAEQQEKMISPEGTYPPIGRSIPYRTGAFQALAMVSWQEKLPKHIDPAQVRGALTKVCYNMFTKINSFDNQGWLELGFCGPQPEVADYYTSTGSLYMATLSFLPLGLPANNPFWTNAPADWTAKAAWSGKPFHKDYHVDY
ncbi:DUF2264 domain-containing protein [Arachidicoccus terrestris]|uniref:DUF2264 domain-containing protein n=1 Tax=Arachidicoccus terrestris TaxID=2875539 RepID=UPI001CC6BFA2|nr:DUF2264 domain-containing protein [Arachidicoccus terrestris]UAY55883.1 DUF2264 domain-containing protein [Arachidicoccus terrestris]